MKKIGIVGLGLIGGSLALAFRKAGYYVVGIPHREETISTALKLGAIDEGSLDLSKLSSCDFVFVCTPISKVVEEIKKIAPNLKSGAIVTDVASTKEKIVREAEKIIPKNAFFVGGHPMAGKEKSKIENADPDLFENKTYILTITQNTDKKGVEDLKEVLSVLKVKIIELSPKEHDEIVSGISHMPLVLAYALVDTVFKSKNKELLSKCASSGFRDTTRIASGDIELGVDMFVNNKDAVLSMLKEFKNSLSKIEKLIKRSDTRGLKENISALKVYEHKIVFH